MPLVRGGWGRRGGNLQRFWFYLKCPDSLRLASTLTGGLLVEGEVFGHRQLAIANSLACVRDMHLSLLWIFSTAFSKRQWSNGLFCLRRELLDMLCCCHWYVSSLSSCLFA
jgi:hypothetical protein